MVGIHLPICTLPYYGGYTPLPICTLPTTLGIPWCILLIPVLHIPPLMVSGSVEGEPWAQERRNPWVRGKTRLKVRNPVRVRGELCALLLRLPEEYRMKDWIDVG